MTLSASAAKYMLEHMPMNVLVCDAKNFTITYANKKSVDTLNALTSLLPRGVSGDTIIGQCIDVFHKQPQHQRNLMGNKKNLPHTAIIRLGKEFLELQVVEVPGGLASSGYFMLTWSVVTMMERLKRMVDKMPINIMMCDPDTFEINFMNETSLNTLRSIENLLPVKADKVLGSCIDIFHKSPAHQRGLLANPKNLPHRAKIKLGTEWLDLNVAAIVDNQGNYLGPMVSWSVVTQQVRVADQVQQIANAVAAASTELSQNSDVMGKTIATANEQSAHASAGAGQTLANVQSVAAAAEEMNTSVREISSNMTKSRVAVEQVAEKALSADKATQSLDLAAQSMGNIVELIQTIAGQINLLALNATIESARAGDAGKGFAVVASEVKNLANQTTKATEEIAKEIGNMQIVSKDVVAALAAIRTSVEAVKEYVTGVASAIEEQTAVTKEISSNMQTAATGVDHISGNISSIAKATQQADESTRQVQEAARMLSVQAEQLNNEMKVLVS
jgi:methyl-accepting chemotaxis protein